MKIIFYADSLIELYGCSVGCNEMKYCPSIHGVVNTVVLYFRFSFFILSNKSM